MSHEARQLAQGPKLPALHSSYAILAVLDEIDVLTDASGAGNRWLPDKRAARAERATGSCRASGTPATQPVPVPPPPRPPPPPEISGDGILIRKFP